MFTDGIKHHGTRIAGCRCHPAGFRIQGSITRDTDFRCGDLAGFSNDRFEDRRHCLATRYSGLVFSKIRRRRCRRRRHRRCRRRCHRRFRRRFRRLFGIGGDHVRHMADGMGCFVPSMFEPVGIGAACTCEGYNY